MCTPSKSEGDCDVVFPFTKISYIDSNDGVHTKEKGTSKENRLCFRIHVPIRLVWTPTLEAWNGTFHLPTLAVMTCWSYLAPIVKCSVTPVTHWSTYFNHGALLVKFIDGRASIVQSVVVICGFNHVGFGSVRWAAYLILLPLWIMATEHWPGYAAQETLLNSLRELWYFNHSFLSFLGRLEYKSASSAVRAFSYSRSSSLAKGNSSAQLKWNRKQLQM